MKIQITAVCLFVFVLVVPAATALPPFRSVINAPCDIILPESRAAGCSTVANLASTVYYQYVADSSATAGSIDGTVWHDPSCEPNVIIANSGIHLTLVGTDGDKWWVQAGVVGQSMCRDTKPYVEYYHFSDQQYYTMISDTALSVHSAYATIEIMPGTGDCPISASSAGWTPPMGLALATPCTGNTAGYMFEVIMDGENMGAASAEGGIDSWGIGTSSAACTSSWLYYGEEASSSTGTLSCSTGSADMAMY